MGDSDLEEIRRARLQQLQQQQGGGSQGGGGAGGGGGGGGGEGSEQEQRQQQQERMRANILSQILTPEAADRLGRIRLVKASRADDVENRLISLAQSGQLRQQVGEEQLREILNAVSEQESKSGGGEQARVVSRRRGGWDDDDDLEDLLRED